MTANIHAATGTPAPGSTADRAHAHAVATSPVTPRADTGRVAPFCLTQACL
jgi:hypothetical protein